MSGCIYQLICSKTKFPFYIGSTMVGIHKRLQGHICFLKRGHKEPVYVYMRINGIIPEIMTIQSFSSISKEELREQEKKWIECYRIMGIFLTNKGYYHNIVKSIKVKEPKIRQLKGKPLSIYFPLKKRYLILELNSLAKEKGVPVGDLICQILENFVAKTMKKLKIA